MAREEGNVDYALSGTQVALSFPHLYQQLDEW